MLTDGDEVRTRRASQPSPALVAALEAALPVDAPGVAQAFHAHGVAMRALGRAPAARA